MSSNSFQNADKLNGIVSVLQFGAVGNGVTDDTAAIQAAVTAAGLYGTVQFPSGVYKITSPITVPAIAGNNVSGITFTATGTATIISPVNLTAMFDISGVGCVFENISFDAGASSINSGIRIKIPNFTAPTNLTVIGCRFTGFTNALLLEGQFFIVERNFFLNCTKSIYFVNNGQNSSITKNLVLGGAIAVHMAKNGTIPGQANMQNEGTRIIDNTFLCTGQNGAQILIDSALEISIIGNIIDQNGDNTPGIYCNQQPGNGISRIKIISNWIAGGKDSYSCWFSGGANFITLIGNTLAETNTLPMIAGLACTDVNALTITDNNSLLDSGNDLVTTNCVNIKQFGNTSKRGQIGFEQNLIDQPFTSVQGLYSNQGVFGGQSITGGGAAPTSTQPVGSLYMRSGGAVGSRLYVSQGGGSWLAVAGV